MHWPASRGAFSFMDFQRAVVYRGRSASGDHEMARGTVKSFNLKKGFGFIEPQGGGRDVFVHISALEKPGLATLKEGQSVEYEEVSNRGRTSVENLKAQR